eukprot:COSAG03_NODE_4977_length_1373_cov_8.958560_1_plen_72_part_00
MDDFAERLTLSLTELEKIKSTNTPVQGGRRCEDQRANVRAVVRTDGGLRSAVHCVSESGVCVSARLRVGPL